jgi:hypothetical protein
MLLWITTGNGARAVHPGSAFTIDSDSALDNHQLDLNPASDLSHTCPHEHVNLASNAEFCYVNSRFQGETPDSSY